MTFQVDYLEMAEKKKIPGDVNYRGHQLYNLYMKLEPMNQNYEHYIKHETNDNLKLLTIKQEKLVAEHETSSCTLESLIII